MVQSELRYSVFEVQAFEERFSRSRYSKLREIRNNG